jgi:hypothetical protein
MLTFQPRTPWPTVLFLLSIAFNIRRLSEAALGPGFETVAIAHALAAGKGFSDPFYAAPTGPTAHAAPLYPALLAAVMVTFGETAPAAFVILGLELLWQALTVALLPAVSKALFGGRGPGYVGAALMIVFPIAHVTPAVEASLTAYLLIAFVATALHQNTGASSGLLGAIALTNPAAALAALPVALYGLGRRRTLVVVLGAGLICGPWVIRNRIVLGNWVPVRDNFGLELSMANDDCAGIRSDFNPCLALTYPNFSRKAAAELASAGEVGYFAERGREARRWIAGHPKRFFDLTAARIGLFWFPDDALAVSAITAIGFLGLWLVRGARAFVPLIGSFCAFPLPYYVVAAEPRRRQPVLWMTALTAGYAITWAIARWSQRGEKVENQCNPLQH